MSDVADLPFTPIPQGETYCTVSPLVNAILTIPEARIIIPSTSETAAYNAPTFIFYITHQPSGKTLLFDLGIRHDWETAYAEDLKGHITPDPPVILGDVAKILSDGGAEPKNVEAVIISHRHWDHTGDVGPFPNAEVVGGKDTFEGDLKQQIAGRKTLVLNFDTLPGLSAVGAFDKAYNYFGDGSVWLCNSPGHTAGHLSALVRTTPSPNATYVLLSGDTCHHPTLISPAPHNFRLASYPARDGGARSHPALPPPCCMHANMDDAWDTVMRTRRMEVDDDVMVVLAHDYTYWRDWKAEGGRLWPGKKGIQGWKEEGLKKERKYDPVGYDKH